MTLDFGKFDAVEAWQVGPDWRWQRAARLADAPPWVRPQHHDPLVQDAAQYLHMQARDATGRALAATRFPSLAAAERLWHEEPLRSHLMMGTIADVPREEIAARLDVDPATVALAEALFFDIRPMLPRRDWIHLRVIRPLIKEGQVELGTKLRTALFGGPMVVKALGEAEVNLPLDEANRLAAWDLLMFSKTMTALEYPLGKEHAAEHIKLTADIWLTEKKLKLRRRIFVQRCKEALRRYKLRKRRLALEAQRLELRRQRLALDAARQGVDLSNLAPSANEIGAAQPSAGVERPRAEDRPTVKAAG